MEGPVWTKKNTEFDKLSLMLASFSFMMYTLFVCNPICLLAFCCQHGVLQWAAWEPTPVLPVVLFAVWCASPCGQTKPSSPRHDAWSDNNLQKPAQTQRERQWVHLQQQDGQIAPRAHRGIHVHMSKCAESVYFSKSWNNPFRHRSLAFSDHIQIEYLLLHWLVASVHFITDKTTIILFAPITYRVSLSQSKL